MGGVNLPPMLLLIAGFAISTTFWPGMAFADELPEPLKYVDMWVSKDGETHLRDCSMHNFTLQSYAGNTAPQYVRSDFGGNPFKVVLSEYVKVDTKQGLHSAPAPQFVIAVGGAWYINTTDGDSRVLRTGDILFQDDTKDCPSDKVPQHRSGNSGSTACQQFIVQMNRTAEVDNPCPF